MHQGTASPAYSLCHLDCGVGKTQTIVAYIQMLLEDYVVGQDVPGMVVFSDRLDDIYAPADEDQPEAGLLVDLYPDPANGQPPRERGCSASTRATRRGTAWAPIRRSRSRA
jgi:hypothetical protein